MKDADIDFSDIPLNLDLSKAEVGKFYRPPKKARDYATATPTCSIG